MISIILREGVVDANCVHTANALCGHPHPQARSVYYTVCSLSVDQARNALAHAMEVPLADDW